MSGHVAGFGERAGLRLATRAPTLLPELAPYWERYTAPAAQAAMRPLLVACDVSGPMGGYDPPTLDGLLARMVVDEAFAGANLDDTGSPYLLPVPLWRLWTHPASGLPLWAANPFRPVGESARGVLYWHKRMIRPEHATRRKGGPQIQPTAGRYKEIRVPMPTVVADRWCASAVGDRDEVARLLSRCTALGKRRRARIIAWYVIEVEEPFELARPVPLEYLGREDAAGSYGGWTPPYWPGVPESQAWCALPGSCSAEVR